MLLPAERDRSRQGGEARAMGSFGFRTMTEQGVSVGYPAKLADEAQRRPLSARNSPRPSGNVTVDILRYPVEEEATDALFERLKTERPGRTITYSLSRPDAFVITGTVDGKSFYMRFLKTATDTRGFVLGWDPALSPGFDRVAIAMAVSLVQATGATSPAVAPPHRPCAPSQPAAPARSPAGPPVPLPPARAWTARKGIGVGLHRRARDVLTRATLVAGCTTVRAKTAEPARWSRRQLGDPGPCPSPGDPRRDLPWSSCPRLQPPRLVRPRRSPWRGRDVEGDRALPRGRARSSALVGAGR